MQTPVLGQALTPQLLLGGSRGLREAEAGRALGNVSRARQEANFGIALKQRFLLCFRLQWVGCPVFH